MPALVSRGRSGFDEAGGEEGAAVAEGQAERREVGEPEGAMPGVFAAGSGNEQGLGQPGQAGQEMRLILEVRLVVDGRVDSPARGIFHW